MAVEKKLDYWIEQEMKRRHEAVNPSPAASREEPIPNATPGNSTMQ